MLAGPKLHCAPSGCVCARHRCGVLPAQLQMVTVEQQGLLHALQVGPDKVCGTCGCLLPSQTPSLTAHAAALPCCLTSAPWPPA